jgi:hypothetical protein
MTEPLAGISVIDLTRLTLRGRHTMLLADAEIDALEPIGTLRKRWPHRSSRPRDIARASRA